MTAVEPASHRLAAAEPSAERPRFRGDVEGLRAFAVLLVIAFHAGIPAITGGYIGVDVFYVISGYLITGLLVDELQRTGTLSFRSFYARRVRRLMPLAMLVLVAVAIGMEFFTPPAFRPAVRFDALSAAFYYSNWQFAIESVNYLTLGGAQNPVLHYWSLSVEEQFYLVWPLLLFATVRLRPSHLPRAGVRLRCAAVVAVVGLASLVYSIVATPASPAIAYFETTTRVWEFAAGACLALGALYLRRVPPLVGVVAGSAGLVMVAVSAFINGPTTEFPGTAALLPVAGTVLVLAAGVCAPISGAGALLSLRPVRYVGRISYAWYLWHWPCLVFARTAQWAPADGQIGWLATGIALVISLVLAIATHMLVETPARRARWFAARGRRVVLLAGVSTAAAVLAVGIAGGPLVVPGGSLNFFGSTPAAAAVPPASTPLEAAASTPYAALHGCHVDYGTQAPATGCVFGDVTARRRVVLIGDSHAAQWFPALEILAKRERFQLIVWTKSGCPFTVGVHIFLPAIGRDYGECLTWQTNVLHRLATMSHPSMIILGRTSTYLQQVRTPEGDQTSSADVAKLWGTGVSTAVHDLRRYTPRVVVLRDTPHAPSDIPACISWDPSNPAVCDFAQTPSGHSDDAEYAAERAAGTPHSAYADPMPAVCKGPVCRVDPNGIIVFRDDNHLTAAFAASRWRAFAQALDLARVRRPV